MAQKTGMPTRSSAKAWKIKDKKYREEQNARAKANREKKAKRLVEKEK